MTEAQTNFYQVLKRHGLAGVCSTQWEFVDEPPIVEPRGLLTQRPGVYLVHDYLFHQPGKEHCIVLEQAKGGYHVRGLTVRPAVGGNWEITPVKQSQQLGRHLHDPMHVYPSGQIEKIIESYLKEPNGQGMPGAAGVLTRNIKRAQAWVVPVQKLVLENEATHLPLNEAITGMDVMEVMALMHPSTAIIPQALFPESPGKIELRPVVKIRYHHAASRNINGLQEVSLTHFDLISNKVGKREVYAGVGADEIMAECRQIKEAQESRILQAIEKGKEALRAELRTPEALETALDLI